MLRESAYEKSHFRLSELEHAYGDRVHLLADPYAISQLARLCSPETVQPAFNDLIRDLYRHLMVAVINRLFPTEPAEIPTRMSHYTPRGVFEGSVLSRKTRVVVVDVARAGILPAQVCYDFCNAILDPAGVRTDHLIVTRATDATGAVFGADIQAARIGGDIEDAIVIFPDPMGATGSSLNRVIQHYKETVGGRPRALITMNLIVTPHFLRAIQQTHPEVELFGLRLDRGLSPSEVLRTPLGERWAEENGLTETDYIVPGGGGFGELMSNSYV